MGSRCSALLPGDARPGSDLDLLVDFEPGASLIDHVGLFQDLEELLGVEVDVVARSTLKPLRWKHSRRGRGSVTRGVDDLRPTLLRLLMLQAEIVGLGKKRWDTERLLSGR
jgi:predicted nucleotidyltransferase